MLLFINFNMLVNYSDSEEDDKHKIETNLQPPKLIPIEPELCKKVKVNPIEKTIPNEFLK